MLFSGQGLVPVMSLLHYITSDKPTLAKVIRMLKIFDFLFAL